MQRWPAQSSAPLTFQDGHDRGTHISVLLAISFGIVLAVLTWFLLGRTNLTAVIIVLGIGVFGSLISYVSWRNMALLVVIWLFSMSGFRTFAMIHMPFVPDISLERVIAVWIAVLFSVRLIMRRDTLDGPFVLDVLLFLHTLYVLSNVMYIGNQIRMHEWMMSSVSPFIGYLIGKNIMRRDGDVRILLYFFLLVTVYYYVQSIAQRYELDFLVWPKGILDRERGHWPMGRSRGPFLHPPLFGQVMGMVLLVQFYFYYRVKGRIPQLLLIGSILLSGMGMLFTYTRAPWVAAAAGIVTLAILRPRYRQLIVSLGVAISILLFFTNLRFEDEQYLQDRLGNTQTIENRLAAASAAARMWRDHPLLGVGYFNWNQYYWRYQRGEEIPFYGYVKRSASRRVVPHDMYLSRMAEEGIVSLALLWVAFGVGYLRWRRLWFTVPEHAWLNRDGLALFAAIFACYLVGGAFIDYRFFDMVNAIPYLLAGILYGYKVPEHDPPPPPYRLWTPPSFASSDDQRPPTASQV